MKKHFTLLCSVMAALAAIGQDVTLAGPAGCNGTAVAGTWQVPCNVTAITIDVYGGGAGAGGGGGGSDGGLFNTRGGGGGGGGAYSTITLNVVPGDVFTYSVGAGGCGGGNGSDGDRGDDGNDGRASGITGPNVNILAGGGIKGGGGSGSGNSPGGGGAGGTATGGTTNDAGGAGANGSGGNGGAGGNGAGPLGGAGGPATNNAGSTYGGGGAGGGNSDGGHGAAGAIVIYYTDSLAAPQVASLPATCDGAGSSAIANYSAAVTYVFDPVGPTVDQTGVISGMTDGSYYTVAASVATCTTAASAQFYNEEQLQKPATPVVASVAATCQADGSSSISNYNADNTYTFTPSGPTVGVGGAISGMVLGTAYTVVASNPCQSGESASFGNQPQLTGTVCDTTGVGIHNVSNEIAISLYPNPSTSQVAINYSNIDWSKGEATVTITNSLGQLAYSQVLGSYSQTQTLDISNLAVGTYTLTIKQQYSLVARAKLVKQ